MEEIKQTNELSDSKIFKIFKILELEKNFKDNDEIENSEIAEIMHKRNLKLENNTDEILKTTDQYVTENMFYSEVEAYCADKNNPSVYEEYINLKAKIEKPKGNKNKTSVTVNPINKDPLSDQEIEFLILSLNLSRYRNEQKEIDNKFLLDVMSTTFTHQKENCKDQLHYTMPKQIIEILEKAIYFCQDPNYPELYDRYRGIVKTKKEKRLEKEQVQNSEKKSTENENVLGIDNKETQSSLDNKDEKTKEYINADKLHHALTLIDIEESVLSKREILLNRIQKDNQSLEINVTAEQVNELMQRIIRNFFNVHSNYKAKDAYDQFMMDKTSQILGEKIIEYNEIREIFTEEANLIILNDLREKILQNKIPKSIDRSSRDKNYDITSISKFDTARKLAYLKGFKLFRKTIKPLKTNQKEKYIGKLPNVAIIRKRKELIEQQANDKRVVYSNGYSLRKNEIFEIVKRSKVREPKVSHLTSYDFDFGTEKSEDVIPTKRIYGNIDLRLFENDENYRDMVLSGILEASEENNNYIGNISNRNDGKPPKIERNILDERASERIESITRRRELKNQEISKGGRSDG